MSIKDIVRTQGKPWTWEKITYNPCNKQRSLRNENSEIFLFHTPNTRDDHYLKEFKQGLDDSFFTYLKLSNL